jgi:hypothetical protein
MFLRGINRQLGLSERLARAFVDQFITSEAQPPEVVGFDLDHAEDPTHDQQKLALFNRHDRGDGDLPLLLFEGLSGKLITAVLRPGTRPTGAENAMILKRVFKVHHPRQAGSDPHRRHGDDFVTASDSTSDAVLASCRSWPITIRAHSTHHARYIEGYLPALEIVGATLVRHNLRGLWVDVHLRDDGEPLQITLFDPR